MPPVAPPSTFRVMRLQRIPVSAEATKTFRSLLELEKLTLHLPSDWTTKQYAADLRRASKPFRYPTNADTRQWKSLSTCMVCVGGGVVASCAAVQTREDEMFDVCTIEGVGTHPDHRGAGHCKRLIRATLEHLAGAGFRAARIHAYTDNPAACRCYRSTFGAPVHVADGVEAFEILFSRGGKPA